MSRFTALMQRTALTLVLALVASLLPSPALAEPPLVDAVVEMTCFPPPPAPGQEPGLGPPPPCTLPAGLPPEFASPEPSGRLHLVVAADDTARLDIRLEGLAPDLVVTAWVSYFFPPGPAPHPIFAPAGPGLPPVAAVSAPLAATTSAFTEGLGPEPNQFLNLPGGRARLSLTLDYNPLRGGQGPLRNGLSVPNQGAAPAGSGAEQRACCPDGSAPQPVGASFLRRYDPVTGFPLLAADGRPELLRSPVPVAFLALVVHVDRTTHGISPGIPILPRPGAPVTGGDHFLLGLFDLRPLHLE